MVAIFRKKQFKYWIKTAHTTNTQHWPNELLILVHWLRRWPNVEITSDHQYWVNAWIFQFLQCSSVFELYTYTLFIPLELCKHYSFRVIIIISTSLILSSIEIHLELSRYIILGQQHKCSAAHGIPFTDSEAFTWSLCPAVSVICNLKADHHMLGTWFVEMANQSIRHTPR